MKDLETVNRICDWFRRKGAVVSTDSYEFVIKELDTEKRLMKTKNQSED